VIDALQRVQPHDWRAFLRQRVEGHGPGAPLEGLARAGWKLVYDEQPNAAIAEAEGDQEYDDFSYSLGLKIASADGKVDAVLWDSPAYRAGLAKDTSVVAVSGMVYNADRLKRAIGAARTDKRPLELLVKQGDAYRTLQLDYGDGLRHPHLERIPGAPDRLMQLLAPIE
jgi:predicted metalloprotease with PDZ domain